MLTKFTPADLLAFVPAMKIGLLATISPDGLPHLTMISTLKGSSPTTLTWGQFTEGLSKENVRRNPQTGFLIMTLDKQVWRGTAHWTHTQKSGSDYDAYNNIPMFRYNAYFGVHTVHFMDLMSQTGRQPLPMNAIILASLKTLLLRKLHPQKNPGEGMNPWTRSFFNKMDNLKFLAYLSTNGYPHIIPVIQAQAAGSQRIIMSAGVYSSELSAIPAGSPAVVLGLALTMEDVLVRGVFTGLRRRAGVRCAQIEVDWVYNPMPPVPGQIYPEQKVAAVDFLKEAQAKAVPKPVP